jgi:glycosyltransferase involved in cell wall biosynthesis
MIEQSQLASESPSAALVADVSRAPRVLFISYQFPPVGGAGVQRPAKFVKYLREFGWEVTVLTPSNPSVPVFDKSLCADLPADLAIVKSRTWEPAYAAKQNLAVNRAAAGGIFQKVRGLALAPVRALAGALLQPDPQVLWLPGAFLAASRLLQKAPHDVIFATAPPYSDLALGALLKKRFGLPLVVDYRDEWDLSSQYLEHSRSDRWTRFVQERMQSWVLRSADAVVATTRLSAERLLERAREARSSAVTRCIYNGFDDDDFELESCLQAAPTRPAEAGTRFGDGAPESRVPRDSCGNRNRDCRTED